MIAFFFSILRKKEVIGFSIELSWMAKTGQFLGCS
jgi:hypothetical protein